MNSKLLIQNAYKYYDEKTDEYEDFISKIFKIKKKNTNSDLKNPIIIFYDKDGKVICESNYEFVGTYKKKSKLSLTVGKLPSPAGLQLAVLVCAMPAREPVDIGGVEYPGRGLTTTFMPTSGTSSSG